MSYDENKMNKEGFGNPWKVANNIDSGTENVEECSLPAKCNELDSWMSSEAGHPHQRLSLRDSSNFIVGAAKLYKRSVDQLFEDINKLEEDITRRRKRGHPDKPSSSISPKKRDRIDSTSPVFTPRVSRSSSKSLPTGKRISPNIKDTSHQRSNNNCDISPNMSNPVTTGNSDCNPEISVDPETNTEGNHRRDQGEQNSSIFHRRINSRFQNGFDTRLKNMIGEHCCRSDWLNRFLQHPREEMDINKLKEYIARRRKRGHPDKPITSKSSSISLESAASPEQMRRRVTMKKGSSISPKKRDRIDSTSPVFTPRVSRSSSKSLPTGKRISPNIKDTSHQRSNNNCDISPNMSNPVTTGNSDCNPEINVDPETNTKESHRTDQGVQTSPILHRRINSRFQNGFDTSLPFGCLMIYDTYNSRIPSKIIFSSINSDVNKLI